MAEATKHALIASDRIEGTEVRRSSGDKLGTIKRLMIDKVSGEVVFAVMNFGGFLGLGQQHFPIPWPLLKYNTELGAYECNVTDDQLRSAKSMDRIDFGDRDEIVRIHVSYGIQDHQGWY